MLDLPTSPPVPPTPQAPDSVASKLRAYRVAIIAISSIAVFSLVLALSVGPLNPDSGDGGLGRYCSAYASAQRTSADLANGSLATDEAISELARIEDDLRGSSLLMLGPEQIHAQELANAVDRLKVALGAGSGAKDAANDVSTALEAAPSCSSKAGS